jgi:uncharacterized protein (TIGR00730 family)
MKLMPGFSASDPELTRARKGFQTALERDLFGSSVSLDQKQAARRNSEGTGDASDAAATLLHSPTPGEIGCLPGGPAPIVFGGAPVSRSIRSIAVFCGSNTGRGEIYLDAARSLGNEIGQAGIRLVYGGTHKGLMGILADAALAAGGEVHGVITQRLAEKGHLHERLTQHEIVQGMRRRKERMAEEADAFIALPGGIGTLEEFMEIWTLNQLGDMDKPAGLFDVGGYYRPFVAFIDHMIAEKFLPEAHRAGIVVHSDAAGLIEGLRGFERITVPKWM